MGQFRRTASALQTGRLMQYTPDKTLYVYFRYDTHQTILCAMNTGMQPVSLDLNRYAERTTGFTQAVDVLTGKSRQIKQPAQLPARTMWVLELKP